MSGVTSFLNLDVIDDGSPLSVTETYAVEPGDVLQVYAKRGTASYVSISDVQVCANYVLSIAQVLT